MANYLTRKLELFGDLSEDDLALLDSVTARTREVAAQTPIIREGDVPRDVHVVLEGIACRCKYLKEGERQIFAYLLPGDFCDMHVFILNAMDHNIETISPCQVADIPRADVIRLTKSPNIARAMWWATLVDEATLREWLVNLGQRNAIERIAHLFCEIHLRMKSIGLSKDGEFSLPITQSELGSTMGLTPVHVNRSLQALRKEGLIEFKSGKIKIANVTLLREMSGFNPNYLHLEGGKRDTSLRVAGK